MKVLIIEDEQPASRRLQRMITEIDSGVEVVGRTDSVEEAVEFFRSGSQVDLVFMDIQLADGISFEIFTQVRVDIPVIFTTAYDHYAIKAFKVNSIDYLLKPIEEGELREAIKKFHTLRRSNSSYDYSEIIRVIREQKEPYKKRFLVKTAGRLAFVAVADIAYFFSDDGHSFLVTVGNDRFLLENILEEIESQLDPVQFFRINRKMIVGLQSIRRIEAYLNNRFQLDLAPGFEEEVIVSRQRSAEFRLWLDR